MSLLIGLAAVALGAEPAPPEKPKKNEKPKTEFEAKGLYTIWGLTQQNFLLGKEVPKNAANPDGKQVDHTLDDTTYTVQMLRVQGSATRGDVGAVARMDLGQGWWGANNNPNIQEAVTTVDPDGIPGTGDESVQTTTVYNGNKLFGNKDTNYGMHVDLAYGWAKFDIGMPLKLSAGRQYYGVGHKLVLDYNYDGVQVVLTPYREKVKVDGKDKWKKATVHAWWAKVCEGRDCYTNPKGLLMSDGATGLFGSDEDAYGDAQLAGLKARLDWPKNHGEVFALYYNDASNQDDWAFLPNGLGYAGARFRPQVTEAVAVGVAGDGTFPVGAGLDWKAEADYLAGSDDVQVGNFAGGTVDRNNGTLSGYNAYVDLLQKGGDKNALAYEGGAVFGLGSGDADKKKGPGNINKIQTMGFFPFTNVWEDSVMPDIEGISPQGLGSPVSRGYREFENTIAAQAKAGLQPAKPVKLTVSYTHLTATTPIHGFDAAGIPTKQSASDIGMEVDANVKVKFNNGLILTSLFGYFIPGDAAGLLINGTTKYDDPAWELKNVALIKF